MKKRTRRWFGALAGLAGVAAGALGAAALIRRRRAAPGEGPSAYPEYRRGAADRWARPGMSVTFRAELMPGRSRSERTFRVAELLTSNRITLEGFAGEHAETEFESRR